MFNLLLPTSDPMTYRSDYGHSEAARPEIFDILLSKLGNIFIKK
jgi:hypothetical protein